MKNLRPKDPWVAILFHFIFTGLGQIYSGRLKRGILFVFIQIIPYVLTYFFILNAKPHPDIYPFFGMLLVFFLVEVFILIDAYRCAKAYNAENNLEKKITFGKRVFFLIGIVCAGFLSNLIQDRLLPIFSEEYFAKNIVQDYQMSAGSMQPTLLMNDRVLVDKIAYRQSEPQRGDIVVFAFPPAPERAFVKRLIAKGGETIEIKDGDIYINDKLNEVPHIKNNHYYARGKYGSKKINVPEGHYYVLGDYSAASHDSRYWGFVPKANIIGKAYHIYYPLSRRGDIQNSTNLGPVNHHNGKTINLDLHDDKVSTLLSEDEIKLLTTGIKAMLSKYIKIDSMNIQLNGEFSFTARAAQMVEVFTFAVELEASQLFVHCKAENVERQGKANVQFVIKGELTEKSKNKEAWNSLLLKLENNLQKMDFEDISLEKYTVEERRQQERRKMERKELQLETSALQEKTLNDALSKNQIMRNIYPGLVLTIINNPSGILLKKIYIKEQQTELKGSYGMDILVVGSSENESSFLDFVTHLGGFEGLSIKSSAKTIHDGKMNFKITATILSQKRPVGEQVFNVTGAEAGKVELAKFFTFIEKESKISLLKLTELRPKSPLSLKDSRKYYVEAKLEGNIENIAQFIKDMLFSENLILIEKLEIEASEDKSRYTFFILLAKIVEL